jgi:hypothetical protein
LTTDEFICVCTSHAGLDKVGYSKGCGEGIEGDCVQVFVARVWEFDVGDCDVFVPMASRYHSGIVSMDYRLIVAEYEEFDEVFVCEF